MRVDQREWQKHLSSVIKSIEKVNKSFTAPLSVVIRVEGHHSCKCTPDKSGVQSFENVRRIPAKVARNIRG